MNLFQSIKDRRQLISDLQAQTRESEVHISNRSSGNFSGWPGRTTASVCLEDGGKIHLEEDRWIGFSFMAPDYRDKHAGAFIDSKGQEVRLSGREASKLLTTARETYASNRDKQSGAA